MLSSAALRRQIETALETRIPGALTPRPRVVRDLAATGVPELDALLQGGLPMGAITELVGPQCSGRSTLALAVLAEMTAAGKVVAWVDAMDTLDPVSAAAAGVDLSRQLWVRCGGASPARTGVTAPAQATSAAVVLTGPGGPPLLVEGSRVPASSGGCGSPHPRGEAQGLSKAIDTFMQPDSFARTTAPRGPDPYRPSLRKNRMIGTPSAPNRQLKDMPKNPLPQGFPRRAADREEQVPTDRMPPRRGANLTPPRRPRNVAAAQIAFTGAVAGAWTDNRNNAAGRCLQTAPNAIAAGLPRFREMEARASGQGHDQPNGPQHWKPSLAGIRARQQEAKQSSESHVTSSMRTAPGQAIGAQRKSGRAGASLAGEAPPALGKAGSPMWQALDQALRATDLLLAAGGFSAVVLDLGSVAPEFAWRIPLATWFRFRAAAERARTVLLVLTQHPCARSSAELVLRLSPTEPEITTTVLTGAGFRIAVDRQRFDTDTPEPATLTADTEAAPTRLHLVPRKPPQRERAVRWHRAAAWAGTR